MNLFILNLMDLIELINEKNGNNYPKRLFYEL